MRQFVGEQLLFWPRRFVLQEQRRIVGTIAFLRGHELAEFFRALQDGAGVRVLRGSLAGVLAQAVQVVIRFALARLSRATLLQESDSVSCVESPISSK